MHVTGHIAAACPAACLACPANGEASGGCLVRLAHLTSFARTPLALAAVALLLSVLSFPAAAQSPAGPPHPLPSAGQAAGQAGPARTEGTEKADAAAQEPDTKETETREAETQETEIPETVPPLHERVVVTAARAPEPLTGSAALVSLVSREELAASPNITLDDTLRRVPGFSLFRRSSSLTAHPTTQGVSLRGVAPSGASRSLVLFDGTPLNDPFGGWVQWNRLPPLALDSVEIARGAGSSLYGSSSLGGTVQLFPVRPAGRRFDLRTQAGTRETFDLEALATDRRGGWSTLAAGRVFTTGGFFLIDESLRGAVDTRAGVDFQTFWGRAYRGDFFAGGNFYHEDRNNGTQLQTNSTRLASFETGVRRDRWSWSFHAQTERFRSDFSRVEPDRSAETLTSQQRFPSTGAGSSVVWRPAPRLIVGTDWRRASWNGHGQNLVGAFVQTTAPLHPRLDLQLGARFDVWENQSARTAASPRAALVFRAASSVTLRASGYGGFRAPTLNELHRPFRVGNVLTLANPGLKEEQLWGGEGGADFHPTGNLLFRLNGFWNSLQDAVANVTVLVEPDLITRQRQNIGRAEIKGLEAEAHWRVGERWRWQWSYLYSDARDHATGLRLPQTARHQATSSLTLTAPVFVHAEGRWVGAQFDDDLNTLRLGGFFLLNASAAQSLPSLGENTSLFLSVENLFGRRYAVGLTPLERLGTPRLLRAGIRFQLPRL